MAKKKYVIKTFNPGSPEHNRESPLINLSKLGLSKNSNIIKTALSFSSTETNDGIVDSQAFGNFYGAFSNELRFKKFRDLTKNQTNNYAYYDQTYSARRQACREMARDNEIAFLMNTITNETVIKDDAGYVAYLDTDRLKMFLNKGYNNQQTNSTADTLIRDAKIGYQTIYSALGWDDNDGASQQCKNLLRDGYIALEILIDHTLKSVIGFLEIDPVTLEPGIEYLEDGTEVFIWYQFRGQENERKIPDSNLIYISWNGMSNSRINNISYVESLTRSYHMLRTLENSQLVWNIQNSGNRMKITIPVGDMTQAKADAYIQEIIAAYSEEVTIDEASGQVLINGEPKFNYQKTYVFESRGGETVTLEKVDTGGYELTTESLQYFWRKFILESQVPANRFTMNISSAPSNQFIGDANVTREEYAFGCFKKSIQSMFKELLLKPLWVQLCLKHPELSKTNYLKQGLGIKFNEENLFTLAKKRALVNEGAQTVSTLMSIVGPDEKPYFSMDFLVKEFLGLTEQQIELNKKYKQAEILKGIEIAKLQKKHENDKLSQTPDMSGGSAEGGGFGGGFGGSSDVMGGGEFGGPEPSGAPEPSGDDGGF